ncbi:MAG: linear amide C-N hydrolase [Clostridia bacterium]|nr:linear amide C-N hydrolase [Clostridia bacterium]
MCTAISSGRFFGRTLDVETEWGGEIVNTADIFGMARMANGVPLWFDAANKYGLGGAALNFPGLAVYLDKSEKKYNIPSYNLIGFVLEKCKNVNEAEKLLEEVNVTPDAFAPDLPPTPLHWIFADTSGCIVFEQTEAGSRVYRNEIGVMTNAPTFPEHLENITIGRKPTDFLSESRFILAVEAKKRPAAESAEQFFDIMKSVFVELGRGSTEKMKTVYTSCIDLEKGEYYCKKCVK